MLLVPNRLLLRYSTLGVSAYLVIECFSILFQAHGQWPFLEIGDIWIFQAMKVQSNKEVAEDLWVFFLVSILVLACGFQLLC